MSINLFENYRIDWIPKIETKDKEEYIYETIAKQLEDDIKSGKLEAGTKLPSQRDLANYLNVNLGTIAKAFKICRHKGLIYGSVGKGTFVSADVASKKLMFTSTRPEEVYDMGSLFFESSLSNELLSKLKRIIEEIDIKILFEYNGSQGTKSQREVIVNFLEYFKINNIKEEILFSSGSQTAISAILMRFFKRGDKIGTLNFTYPGIKAIASSLGIQLSSIELENQITRESLEQAYKNEKIKGIYLIPDNNIPTAESLSEEKRRLISDFAIEKNLIIIEDAVFSLLEKKDLNPIFTYAPNNTFYIFNTSKLITHGLRIAFLLAPKKYLDDLKDSLYNLNIAASPLLIEVFVKLIDNKIIFEILNENKKNIIKRNRIIDKYLGNYQVKGEGTSLFRWVLLPENINGKDFEKLAYSKGVQVYCSERYVVGKEKLPEAIRVSTLSIKDEKDFEKAIKIVKKLLEEKI